MNQQTNNEIDLEAVLHNTDWLIAKVNASDDYATSLYSAMCNMGWQPIEVIPILRDQFWSCSWRYAGGIIAELRGEGDYLDWYCAGNEGIVADEIRKDLASLGWQPYDYARDF
ncbi:MAG TPA: hypothetical protein VFM18_18190 [Methanosarcina sp.]|nr:hypothetical protein [Methanosarcina sp.]